MRGVRYTDPTSRLSPVKRESRYRAVVREASKTRAESPRYGPTAGAQVWPISQSYAVLQQAEVTPVQLRGGDGAIGFSVLRSPALLMATLVLVGLSLRVAWVLYVGTFPLGGDPNWYYNVATNIAHGNGFVADHHRTLFDEHPIIGQPTAAWPPAYSFVLAGMWAVLGIGVTSAKVLNAVLSALTIPFVYLLARSIFGKPAGWLAAAAFAIFPNAIAWSSVLFPEELFTFVFVVALWILIEPARLRGGRWRAPVAFGLLTGAATLTRGEGVVLIPVGVVFWLTRDGWRGSMRHTTLAALGLCAVVLPWSVRNWEVMHAVIPVSTSSGIALRIGHSPQSTGTTEIVNPPEPVDGVPVWEQAYYPDTEVRSYRAYTSRSISYALHHPRRELDLSRYKIYHLYRSDTASMMEWVKLGTSTPIYSESLEDALWRMFDVSQYAVMFVAVGSAVFWLRRDPKRLLLANVILMWTLFHIVFSAEPRYHVPLFPIFVVAAAGGVCIAFDGMMRRASG